METCVAYLYTALEKQASTSLHGFTFSKSMKMSKFLSGSTFKFCKSDLIS